MTTRTAEPLTDAELAGLNARWGVGHFPRYGWRDDINRLLATITADRARIKRLEADLETWEYRWRDEEARATTAEAALREVKALVDQQAEDDGLWFHAETAAEAFVQRELRKLHAAVDGVSPQEIARDIIEGMP